MKAIVVNCSAPQYNLGAAKLADWLEGEGHTLVKNPDNADLIALSVIFSWDAQNALTYWKRYRGREIWCGGPGMFALAKWWKEQTGLDCVRGLDSRFEKQYGDYKMVFASRGCPVNCWFCIVPRIEGLDFTLNWDFTPAPILCDNNLSALPDEFQDHIIEKYKSAGVPLLDANSGFEPRSFTAETYARWRGILRGPWRFAFDTMSEASDVERMMRILKEESPRKKQVYCLIGNEPVAMCYERAQKIIEWGGEPYCQPVLPLNALDRRQYRILHDWTAIKLMDFQRYYNRHVWRGNVSIQTYNNRTWGQPSFAGLKG